MHPQKLLALIDHADQTTEAGIFRFEQGMQLAQCGADLTEANLGEGEWRDIHLRGAEVPANLLATAKSLQGATMPDGTKHE